MALIDWSKVTLTDPPQLPREVLRELKKGIDGTFREFSRGYGEAIENFFHPLLMFLKWFQDLLIETPWPFNSGHSWGFVLVGLAQLENGCRYSVGLSFYRLARYVGRHNGDAGDCISGDAIVHRNRNSYRHFNGAQRPSAGDDFAGS